MNFGPRGGHAKEAGHAGWNGYTEGTQIYTASTSALSLPFQHESAIRDKGWFLDRQAGASQFASQELPQTLWSHAPMHGAQYVNAF